MASRQLCSHHYTAGHPRHLTSQLRAAFVTQKPRLSQRRCDRDCCCDADLEAGTIEKTITSYGHFKQHMSDRRFPEMSDRVVLDARRPSRAVRAVTSSVTAREVIRHAPAVCRDSDSHRLTMSSAGTLGETKKLSNPAICKNGKKTIWQKRRSIIR